MNDPKFQEFISQSGDTFRQVVEDNPFGVFVVDHVPVGSRDFAEVLRRMWPEPFATEAINHFRHTLATGEP